MIPIAIHAPVTPAAYGRIAAEMNPIHSKHCKPTAEASL